MIRLAQVVNTRSPEPWRERDHGAWPLMPLGRPSTSLRVRQEWSRPAEVSPLPPSATPLSLRCSSGARYALAPYCILLPYRNQRSLVMLSHGPGCTGGRRRKPCKMFTRTPPHVFRGCLQAIGCSARCTRGPCWCWRRPRPSSPASCSPPPATGLALVVPLQPRSRALDRAMRHGTSDRCSRWRSQRYTLCIYHPGCA